MFCFYRGFYWLSGHKLILEKFQLSARPAPPQSDLRESADSSTASKPNSENKASPGGGTPKRRLNMPAFRRKVVSGLHGPKYQFFKREMDKRAAAEAQRKRKEKKGGKGKAAVGSVALDSKAVKKMKPSDLKKHLKAAGLSIQGNKKVLIARLLETL